MMCLNQYRRSKVSIGIEHDYDQRRVVLILDALCMPFCIRLIEIKPTN